MPHRGKQLHNSADFLITFEVFEFNWVEAENGLVSVLIFKKHPGFNHENQPFHKTTHSVLEIEANIREYRARSHSPERIFVSTKNVM